MSGQRNENQSPKAWMAWDNCQSTFAALPGATFSLLSYYAPFSFLLNFILNFQASS